MKSIISRIYHVRFEFFFITICFILFGSLIVPELFFEETLMPILLLINLIAGMILISKNRKLTLFLTILFFISLIVIGRDMIVRPKKADAFNFIQMGLSFIAYACITMEVILQILRAKLVNRNVIIGLMSGYITLGVLAFFMFTTIEMAHPGSFSGQITAGSNFADKIDGLLYYSFITLLTIGYGDIVPTTVIGQKAVILTGLIGHFYTIVITAVVMEKYIRHSNSKQSKLVK